MTEPSEFPFRFTCRRSGNCCSRPQGIVRVTDDDVQRMAAHLGMQPGGFRSRFVASAGDRLVHGTDSRCVFLQDGAESSCAIYPVRPEQCASWPFWPSMRDAQTAKAAARFCPGLELEMLSADAPATSETADDPA